MNVLVCGTRISAWTYTNVANVLSTFPRETRWMCGGARGVDGYVVRWAKLNGAHLDVYRPCYEDRTVPYHQAPLVRNEFMLELGPDRVVAFWDGLSRGTKFVLDEAHKRGIHTETWLV